MTVIDFFVIIAVVLFCNLAYGFIKGVLKRIKE